MIDKTKLAYVPPAPPSEAEIMEHWGEDLSVVVSVICITFNHATFIESALNSILMQKTKFRFEILIRDDASTDGTSDIVRKYAKQYPSIIRAIIEQENTYSKGVAPWAVLFPMSKGRYIAHCEGDDYWGDEQKLQIQVEHLDQNPDCVMVFHDSQVVDQNGKLVDRPKLLEGQPLFYSRDQLALTGVIPNLTRCYRNLVKDLPAEFSRTHSGDTFVSSMLSLHGYAEALLGVRDSYYRVHSGGIWQGIDKEQRKIDVVSLFYWLSIYHSKFGSSQVASKLLNASIIALRKSGVKLNFIDRVKLAAKLLFFK